MGQTGSESKSAPAASPDGDVDHRLTADDECSLVAPSGGSSLRARLTARVSAALASSYDSINIRDIVSMIIDYYHDGMDDGSLYVYRLAASPPVWDTPDNAPQPQKLPHIGMVHISSAEEWKALPPRRPHVANAIDYDALYSKQHVRVIYGRCPMEGVMRIVNMVSTRTMYFISTIWPVGRAAYVQMISLPLAALHAAIKSPFVPNCDDDATITSLLPWNTSYARVAMLRHLDDAIIWRRCIVLTGTDGIDPLATCVYDTVTNEYRDIASRPIQMGDPRLTVCNDELYMWQRAMKKVWRYDDATNRWQDVPLLSSINRYITALLPTSYGLVVCAHKLPPALYRGTYDPAKFDHPHLGPLVSLLHYDASGTAHLVELSQSSSSDGKASSSKPASPSSPSTSLTIATCFARHNLPSWLSFDVAPMMIHNRFVATIGADHTEMAVLDIGTLVRRQLTSMTLSSSSASEASSLIASSVLSSSASRTSPASASSVRASSSSMIWRSWNELVRLNGHHYIMSDIDGVATVIPPSYT